MNDVEKLIEKEYISRGLFHYNNAETIKNENGTFRKITLEANIGRSKVIICFEFVRFSGWACSSTYIDRDGYKGALLNEKALRTQSKIIRALEKMDEESE